MVQYNQHHLEISVSSASCVKIVILLERVDPRHSFLLKINFTNLLLHFLICRFSSLLHCGGIEAAFLWILTYLVPSLQLHTWFFCYLLSINLPYNHWDRKTRFSYAFKSSFKQILQIFARKKMFISKSI